MYIYIYIERDLIEWFWWLESAAILSNWNQVFGLMKQATGQNGQTLYLDKIPIDQDNS